MNKVLVDAYLAHNLGDDLFLKILFDKYPDVNFVISERGKTYKKTLQNYKNVKVQSSLVFRVLRKLGIKEKRNIFNKYDALIYIGGSMFIQFDGWEKQYAERKTVIKTFLDSDKPVFIIGANFGPFDNKDFVEKYKSEFSKCRDICFRDKYSYDLFKELNNVRIAPDIVFQLKTEKVEKIKKSIGISIINLEDRDDLKIYQDTYNLKIKEIVEKAISNGNIIKFFSFCEEQGDITAINNIINLVEKKYHEDISIVNYSGNIDEFLLEFEKMENIIGIRFHACILSQIFNQGLYPIIYSDKTYNALKDVDMQNEYTYIKDLENLDVDHIFKVISENKIKDNNIFNEAEKQFEGFEKYV